MVLAARERRLPRRGAGHRQRAVGARSARAAAREAAGGRPGAPALSRRALGFPVAARAVGILRGAARRRSSRTAGWSTPAARSSSRTCGCANGATSTRSSRARWPSRAGSGTQRLPATIDAARYAGDPPGAARRAARQHRQQGRGRRRLPRRARHPLLPASRAPGSRRRAPSGCSPPSWSRPRGCTRAARRRSSPNGSRRSPAIA